MRRSLTCDSAASLARGGRAALLHWNARQRYVAPLCLGIVGLTHVCFSSVDFQDRMLGWVSTDLWLLQAMFAPTSAVPPLFRSTEPANADVAGASPEIKSASWPLSLWPSPVLALPAPSPLAVQLREAAHPRS